MSCEKDRPEQPEEEVVQPDEPTNDTEKFLGYWVRIENMNEGVAVYKAHTYRFWENGKGYITNDSYREDGSIGGYSRVPISSYWVEDGKLYVDKGGDDEIVVWTYEFADDQLTLISEEYDVRFTFTKSEDAGMRLMGTWDVFIEEGDYLIKDIIQFVTPQDGRHYTKKYEDPITPVEGQTYDPKIFKYTFTNNKVTMMTIGMWGWDEPVTKYYRIVGSKLYLSDTPGGEEICYTDFYKEYGIEPR